MWPLSGHAWWCLRALSSMRCCQPMPQGTGVCAVCCVLRAYLGWGGQGFCSATHLPHLTCPIDHQFMPQIPCLSESAYPHLLGGRRRMRCYLGLPPQSADLTGCSPPSQQTLTGCSPPSQQTLTGCSPPSQQTLTGCSPPSQQTLTGCSPPSQQTLTGCSPPSQQTLTGCNPPTPHPPHIHIPGLHPALCSTPLDGFTTTATRCSDLSPITTCYNLTLSVLLQPDLKRLRPLRALLLGPPPPGQHALIGCIRCMLCCLDLPPRSAGPAWLQPLCSAA